jgi:penicillin-binding protein 1A
VKIDGYQPWTTRNAEGGGGSYSLRTATEESVNCAYARLIAAVGPAKVAAMAKRMGITREPPAYPSITLGTVGASPLEMATVYSTLAAEGVRHDPVFVTKVLDRDGRVIFDTAPRAKRVLDVEIARTETDILTGVIRNGTGTRANIGRPAAGKTGTTDDKTNAWFVGYTPQLVAAVWMGDPAAYTPMKNVGRFGEVFGGTYPAVIWHEFMVAALRNQPVKKFTAPDQTLWPKPASITDKGRGVPWSSFTGATGSTGVTGPTGPSGPSGPTGETPGTSTTTVPEVTTTTVAPPPTTVASIGRVTGPR